MTRALRALVVLACLAGCSGGGSSKSTAPVPPWFKFRQNVNNSARGVGAVGTSNGLGRWAAQIDATTPLPVSASPAISADGAIYVGSEGGTLAALTLSGVVRWRVNTCSVCPPPLDTTPFGALVSSPVVFAFNGIKSVYLGSADGRFVVFADHGSSATCTACFVATMVDDSIESASFESSATITTHPLLANVTGVFVGATVHYPSPTPVAGRLYALNSNGAMQWMFPAAGGHPIRPVTSSPALGSGNVLYLTTDDGLLLAVSPSGAELWRHQLSVPVPTSGLAPSPMTSASNVYAASTQGMTAALTLDGQIVWAQMEDDAFASSLALGAQIALTPTSTPAGAATATPQANVTSTPTPSPTPTAVSQVSTIFGVTRSGVLVVRNAADGTQLPPSGPLPTPVDGDVVSSPALSFDNFLVFGTSTGMLYVVNTATGLPATGWPVAVTNGMAIRSSPSIGNDGTIYVGADDGQLHAIGNK